MDSEQIVQRLSDLTSTKELAGELVGETSAQCTIPVNARGSVMYEIG